MEEEEAPSSSKPMHDDPNRPLGLGKPFLAFLDRFKHPKRRRTGPAAADGITTTTTEAAGAVEERHRDEFTTADEDQDEPEQKDECPPQEPSDPVESREPGSDYEDEDEGHIDGSSDLLQWGTTGGASPRLLLLNANVGPLSSRDSAPVPPVAMTSSQGLPKEASSASSRQIQHQPHSEATADGSKAGAAGDRGIAMSNNADSCIRAHEGSSSLLALGVGRDGSPMDLAPTIESIPRDWLDADEARQEEEVTTAKGDKGNLSSMTGSRPEVASVTASASGWSCPRCTLANPIRSRRCGACHERRPVTVQDGNESGGSPLTPTPSRKRKMASASPAASPGLSPRPEVATANRRRPKESGSGGNNKDSTGNRQRRSRSSVTKRRDGGGNKIVQRLDPPLATGKGGIRLGDDSTEARHDNEAANPKNGKVQESATRPSDDDGGAAATGRCSLGSTAVRVSTSPFVSVLPVPVSEAAAATTEPSRINQAEDSLTSTTPHEPPPNDSAGARTSAAASMLKVVRDRFEMQNRWFRERVLEGQRVVKLRRDDLDRAERELRRAEDEWRAFQIEYDAVRNQQHDSEPAGSVPATKPQSEPSSSNPNARPGLGLRDDTFDTPMLNPSVARPTRRLSWAPSTGRTDGSGSISPSLLCLETGSEATAPATSQSKTQGIPSGAPPVAALKSPAFQTYDKSSPAERVGLQLHGSHSLPTTMRRSLSQHSTSSSTVMGLDSPLIDSQATIDPDLDPHHALLPRHRVASAAPIAGTCTYRPSNVVPMPSSVEKVTAGAEGRVHDAPANESLPMQPPVLPSQKKPTPLLVSTNRAQPTSSLTAVWDSTKSSRDFIAPRAAKATVDAADATRAAETATGEWIQAAKHARQNQRDRSKASEPLWDDDMTQQSPRQEPNYPYHDVVRCKAERQKLPCHDCNHCRAFYAALPEEDALKLLEHSRHRAEHSPSETPQDFWVSDFIDEVEKERQEKLNERFK